MSLSTSARFARRELRGGVRGFRIFLACLALGVAAIAGVGSVRSAIQAGLQDQGAVLLGGDAQAEFTYRFATGAERAWLDSIATQVSEITDFRSMATVTRDGKTERGLTQMKSVDAAYPLVGEMVLNPPIPLSEALQDTGAVMAPVLADRLGLQTGDRFRLGTQEFTLRATIQTEPDDAGDGFGLGPRTIVRTADLKDSGLLGEGSLFETKYRLRLPRGTDLDQLRKEALTRYEDHGLS